MPKSEQDIIREALERFQLAADAEHDQRQREEDDLRFEFDPWPDEAKRARGGYTYQNETVPARPMLNIPMLDQPIQLVINQEKGAHLGITVHPEGEDADDDTADVIQGLIRHIEVKSRANLARSWAFERAAKCGRGFYELVKVYAHPDADGPEAYDQELVVRRILNQFSVYFDPAHIEPDCSDAMWAFKVEDLAPRTYKSRYPDSKLVRMANDEIAASADELASIGDDAPAWLKDRIRVAEYWTVDLTNVEHVALKDGRVGYASDLKPTKDQITRKRTIQRRTVTWRLINAIEILDEVQWDGPWIPIIPTIGREYNVNGDRIFRGIIGPAKDSARFVNYTASSIAEKIAIDVKTPWIMAEGQEEGHIAEFVRASARPVPFVRYKPTSLAGVPVPPPERNIAGPNIQGDIAALQLGKDFVHSSTFTFDPSLGNLPQKDRSGKAIQALQQQSDAGNSHYLDNLGDVSMTHEGRVAIESLPGVYDRPGRVQEIITGRDERKKVILNQPFYYPKGPDVNPGTPGKPSETPVPLQDGEQPPNGEKVLHYDLKKGKYAVVVSVGKSYQTRMQQGSDALGQLLQADPNLMPVIGWRYFKYNDNIPGHDEIAEDLKKLRPPQLQGDGDQQQQQTEQMKQQLAQLAQQSQLLAKELEAKTEYIQTEQAKYGAQVQIQQAKTSADVEIARMNNAAKIEVARISAAKDTLNQAAAAEEERLATGLQLAQEAQEADNQRAHELAMAAVIGDQSQQQSAQDASQQAMLAEQAHGQTMEQTDQQGQITAQQQAAQAAQDGGEAA